LLAERAWAAHSGQPRASHPTEIGGELGTTSLHHNATGGPLTIYIRWPQTHR